MSYQVLARKWRPHSFSEMVGQQHVLTSLIHSLDQNRLHHAYLFTGCRGVGKTSVARIMAKCLNCETGVTSKPCGECQACIEIDQGRFMDLIEIDAASRTKVEDTREILDNVQYAPTRGRFKVYLIDEVHMLSSHSFNALLKTLEEPPEHVKFLLATTEPKKLPITVLSRCLQFYLKNISQPDMIERLSYILQQESIKFEPAALQLIARAATGSLRDALSLLDQSIAFGDGGVNSADCQQMLGMLDDQKIIDIAQALISQDNTQLKTQIDNLQEQSTDFMVLLDSLSRLFYEVSLAQVIPTMDHFDFDKEAVHDIASQTSKEQVQLLYQVAIKAKQDLPWAPDLKTGFEMALLRLFAFAPATLAQPQQAAPAPQATVRIQNDDVPAPVQQPTQPQQVKPVSEPAAQQPVPEAPKPVATPISGDIDWLDLAPKLPLVGMAKQLAAHCSMQSLDGNHLTLVVESQHAHVLSDALLQKMQTGLRELTQQPIKLSIEVGQQEVVTPAKVSQDAADNRQQQAENAIQNDELANFIQNQFNASVEPNSVKPIEERK